MELIVQTIFESIEQNESKAAEMYRKLINNIDDPEVKQMLKKLLDDELHHDKFFADFDKLQLREVNTADLEKMKNRLSEEFAEVDPDKDDLRLVLDKAIKDEEIARSCYETLAQNLEGQAKEDLLTLAGHEKHHKEVLEEIKRRCC